MKCRGSFAHGKRQLGWRAVTVESQSRTTGWRVRVGPLGHESHELIVGQLFLLAPPDCCEDWGDRVQEDW